MATIVSSLKVRVDAVHFGGQVFYGWGSVLVPKSVKKKKGGFVEQRNLFKPIMYPRAKHKTSIAQFEWPSSDLFQQHMFLAKMN